MDTLLAVELLTIELLTHMHYISFHPYIHVSLGDGAVSVRDPGRADQLDV